MPPYCFASSIRRSSLQITSYLDVITESFALASSILQKSTVISEHKLHPYLITNSPYSLPAALMLSRGSPVRIHELPDNTSNAFHGCSAALLRSWIQGFRFGELRHRFLSAIFLPQVQLSLQHPLPVQQLQHGQSAGSKVLPQPPFFVPVPRQG